jgi:copper chaperone CopZ
VLATSGTPVVANNSHKRAANETAIYVADMHCAGCAKKIAGRLFRVKGVMRVRTDYRVDLAIVTPQAKKQLDPKALWAAVQAARKHPTKLIGPHGTFVAQEKTGLAQKVADTPHAGR